MAKTQVVGQTITGETLPFADTAYIDCTFNRCRFIFDGSGMHIDGCDFNECEYQLVGPANATIDYLAMLWKAPGSGPVMWDLISRIVGDRDVARRIVAMRHDPPPHPRA